MDNKIRGIYVNNFKICIMGERETKKKQWGRNQLEEIFKKSWGGCISDGSDALE